MNKLPTEAGRVLAILECRESDDAVCTRAVELAEKLGGYITFLAVVPSPFPNLNGGPYYIPSVSQEELFDAAFAAAARASARVPPHVPHQTAIEKGRLRSVIGRRAGVAEPDVVVLRERSRRHARGLTVPIEFVTSRDKGTASNT